MKKITLRFSLLVLAGMFSIAGTAQTIPREVKAFGKKILSEKSSYCGSTENEENLQKQDPKRLSNEAFENWIAPKVAEAKAKRLQKNGNTILTLPVVVHVIHNGDAEGFNENISEAQILSQIEVLNQDFRKMANTPGFNSNEVGADIELEFCLAKRTPTGENTTGIMRYEIGDDNGWETEEANTQLKPFTQWDPEKYINIWVVDFVYRDTGNSRISLAGYAQFPSGTNLDGLEASGGFGFQDGVVIDHKYFGSANIFPEGTYDTTNNMGRTTTHELGHFFGLRHIWGDGGCNVDDFCDDTPVAGQANSGCEEGTDTCPALGVDMIENYMDYTNDACKNIFTQDQKARIDVVMNQAARRASLKTSNSCSPAEVFNTDGALFIQRINLADCSNAFAPSLVLQNEGNTTMTSAIISYNIDGGSANQYTWTGNLIEGQKTSIQLDGMTAGSGVRTLNVALTSVNGINDENSMNDAKLASFRIVPSVVTEDITVTINTDMMGSDTYWFLFDDDQNIYGSGGPYQDFSQETFTQNIAVQPERCYMFYIIDFGGDGLCCENGEGSYTLSTSDNIIIAQGGTFGQQDFVRFGVTETLGTTNVDDTLNSIRLYPNPAHNTLNIAIANEKSMPENYTIYNSLGQIMDSGKVLSKIHSINTEAYADGVYFIKLSAGNVAKTMQFIKY
ncbi:M43 family zinc metalloprotease [Flavobacterium hauense]